MQPSHVFLIFDVPRPSKIRSKSMPKCLQNQVYLGHPLGTLKNTIFEIKMPPKWIRKRSQDSPKMFQDAAGYSQDAPKTLKDANKAPQEAPRGPNTPPSSILDDFSSNFHRFFIDFLIDSSWIFH